MPKLTNEYIQRRLSDIEKRNPLKCQEADKYLFYNGAVRPLLEQKIRAEFKNPENIEGLIHRLLPLNIMKRIVDKLCMLYVEKPIRASIDTNEADIELLQLIENVSMYDTKMKESEQYFEIYKKCLAELFVDERGYPKLRILPPHTYYTFSDSLMCPNIPDCVVKIIKRDTTQGKTTYIFWTAEEVKIVSASSSGSFENEQDMMRQLNNEQGLNPYGVMPFVYLTLSDLSTEPIPDDDLYWCSLNLPILLTDLSFGSKYMAYSLVYTINHDGDLPWSPATVLHLYQQEGQPRPEVGQVKPTIDIDATLRLIEAITSYLLSTKGLKSSNISGTLTQDNAISGISKAIDNAELASINKDKQEYFNKYERDIWLLFKTLLPLWRKSGKLNPKYNLEFSQPFDLDIKFKDIQVTMSAKEQVELSKVRVDNGFSTLKRELAILYPYFSNEQIDGLYNEIKNEKKEAFDEMKESFNKGEEGGNPEDNEQKQD